MASAGTLLSDLDGGGGGGGGDGDLVQKILSDMNIPSSSQRPSPPPLPAQTPVYHQQMASSTAPMSMDSRIPTSHMIGNEHPTPADFAAAMAGAGSGPVPMHPMHPMNPMMPAQQQQEGKNFYGRVVDEIKVPIVVALLFFVFSLPPIRVLLAHYLPTFLKSTGEFNTVGLVAVSGIVGASFWILQRVIAPLLSL